MNMKESLEDKLKKFNPSSEDDLIKKEGKENPFYGLAEAFLYGGYVSVNDHNGKRYRIYIRTVEFYCHYEGDKLKLPKDPIVYHRNGKFLKRGKEEEKIEVPYFPLMAFHAHASGIDITFENEELQLRSSALIRAYEVYDVKRKKFLIFDKGNVVECDDKKKRVNSQSTYLYYFLNGFIGNSVEWIDSVRPKSKEFKITTRKNVYKYKGEEKTPDKDDKKWSYTRSEDLNEKI